MKPDQIGPDDHAIHGAVRLHSAQFAHPGDLRRHQPSEPNILWGRPSEVSSGALNSSQHLMQVLTSEASSFCFTQAWWRSITFKSSDLQDCPWRTGRTTDCVRNR